MCMQHSIDLYIYIYIYREREREREKEEKEHITITTICTCIFWGERAELVSGFIYTTIKHVVRI